MSAKIEFKPTAHDKRGLRPPGSSNLVYTDLDVRIGGMEYAGNVHGFVDPRVKALILDAPALLETLSKIVHEHERTHDATESPVAVMIAAARLVSKHEVGDE